MEYYQCITFDNDKYAIRNKHGIVCWVRKPMKFHGQEERYTREVKESMAMLETILNALNSTQEPPKEKV